MVAVELEHVSAGYPAATSGEVTVDRIHDVSFAVQRSQLCVLLGPNGAGKSTLLRAIAGVVPLSSGRLTLFEKAAVQLDRQSRARSVAIVPQHSPVALGFSVRQVVAMGRSPHQGVWLRPTRDDEQAVDQALATCDLGGLAHRPVAELSGGEQKRVHIARALAQAAPLLLLDEASAHLDVRHALELFRIVRAQVRERQLTCVAAMHDLNAAASSADQVILLKDGRMVAEGSVDQVMIHEKLADAFGAQLEIGRSADGRRYFLPKA